MAATKALTKLYTEITSCSSAVHECRHLCTVIYTWSDQPPCTISTIWEQPGLSVTVSCHVCFVLSCLCSSCWCCTPASALFCRFVWMTHGRRCLIYVKCAHFKLTVSARKQTNMYTQLYTAVLLVWGSLMLTLVYVMLFAPIYDTINANIM